MFQTVVKIAEKIVSSVKVQKEVSIDYDPLNNCEGSMNSDNFL